MLRKRTLVTLIVMVISMAFCLAAWSEPNPKQPISQSKSSKLSTEKPSNQEKPIKDAVTFQILVEAISRAIDASAEKPKAYQNPRQPDNSTFWFSLFLVIFTGVLATVAIFQFFVLKSTLRETQVVAKAATDSARVAETALHVAERAYLKIANFKLVNFSKGDHINVSYEIHNVGHTPAQLVESLTIVDVVEKDSFKIPVYDIEKGLIGPKQAFIQPDEKASMIGISKEPVTLEQFNSVQNDKKLIFAWGKITFRDVFGKTWVNGFGTVFSKVYGITAMDAYNYTKECE